MSTPLYVALNVLDVLTGGTGSMGKHSATEKKAKKADDSVTYLYGGVVVVSKR